MIHSIKYGDKMIKLKINKHTQTYIKICDEAFMYKIIRQKKKVKHILQLQNGSCSYIERRDKNNKSYNKN